MTNEVTTQDQDWANYVATQKAQTMRSSIPSPMGLKLNGNTGTFSTSKFDDEKKEWVFTPFAAEGAFQGVVLAVRQFAKWKHDPNAQFDIRTREFERYDEPIELLKIPVNDRKNAETTRYENYYAFKDAMCTTDKVSGKVTSPYDFTVSIYVLVGKELLRYRFKGDTRNAWFEYGKLSKEPLPTVFTKFGVSEPKEMPARNGEEAKIYYHGTFTWVGDITGETRSLVMNAMNDLDLYFGYWAKKNGTEAPMQQIAEPSEIGTAQTQEDMTPIDELGF